MPRGRKKAVRIFQSLFSFPTVSSPSASGQTLDKSDSCIIGALLNIQNIYRIMSLLSKQDFNRVIDDGVRIRCFGKIYDLSMQAADAIDKNIPIDDYIVKIESLVDDLVKIPRGYNSKQVSAECGQHLIDDIKSLDSALIRSKWTMVSGTAVKSLTWIDYANRLVGRLTRLGR